MKIGMEVQEGLESPFQQKIGFTQMLCVFRVDTSNANISLSIFARQGPFSQVPSHILGTEVCRTIAGIQRGSGALAWYSGGSNYPVRSTLDGSYLLLGRTSKCDLLRGNRPLLKMQ